MFDAMNISASALTAQRLRMDVISQNIANAQTTRTPEGGPYRRRTVIFQEIGDSDPFRNMFSDAVKRGPTPASKGTGVRVSKIAVDESPGVLQYDPHHPDADAEGYVRMPNVNIIEEMVNMISASRSYEAGITAINTSKAMIARTLDLGK